MTETQAFYGKRALDLLPGQPSLKTTQREKAEEDAGEAIDLYLLILCGKVESFGFSRGEAIDLIKEGFDRELKK